MLTVQLYDWDLLGSDDLIGWQVRHYAKIFFLCRLSICLTRNILLSFYGTQIIVSHEHYGLRVFRSGSEPMTPAQADQANYHKI